MDLGLRGKTAVVMAASEGLGFGVARALARAGANIGICGRRKDKVEAAAQALRTDFKVEAHSLVADVSRAAESARVIEATLKALKTDALDVLVNNGGGPPPGPVDKFDDEAWKQNFELLVLSNVRACRAAFPHLKIRGG